METQRTKDTKGFQKQGSGLKLEVRGVQSIGGVSVAVLMIDVGAVRQPGRC